MLMFPLESSRAGAGAGDEDRNRDGLASIPGHVLIHPFGEKKKTNHLLNGCRRYSIPFR